MADKSTHTIVDWLIDSGKVDYEGVLGRPTNKEVTRNAIINLGDRRVIKWMNTTNLEARSTKTGRSIVDEIQKNNEAWEAEINSEISNISDEADLNILRDRIIREGTSFEDETVSNVLRRLPTITYSITRNEIRTIERQISRASSFGDIQNISLDNIPSGEQRDRLVELINDRQSDLEISQEQSVSQDLSRLIDRARDIESLDSLRAIVREQTVTTRSESELLGQIDDRIQSLEDEQDEQ